MRRRCPSRIESRRSVVLAVSVLALASAAILAPLAQADLVTPEPPGLTWPTVPPVVPASVPPASPPASIPTGKSSHGSTSHAPSPSPEGPSSAPGAPAEEPQEPDLPQIGAGCDIGCMEKWAVYDHAWVQFFGQTPLSQYNPSDFADLQMVAADLAAIGEEIATALIAGAHTTLTDTSTESFDGAPTCVNEHAPDGDPVLCPY